jgi:SAM-dependent methyltransferase
VEQFAREFEPSGPIVEIGSLYLPGYEQLSNLRPLFSGEEYLGCDIRRGLGVDRVEDAHSLSFPESSVGVVLMFEILEHLPSPARALAEARRVLREDGVLALSVPFHYRIHGFPTDYWRFTASGVYELLSKFADKTVFAVGPRLKPAFIFAVAAKSATPEFARKTALFRRAVEDHFQRTRWRGHLSLLKERGRDFIGHLLGRSEMTVQFYDPKNAGGYVGADRLGEDPFQLAGAGPSAHSASTLLTKAAPD